MAAFTPGPWTHGIGFVRNMGRDVLGVGVQAVGDGDWTPVAALSFVEDVNDTDRANARLIAAAPDLLAALVEERRIRLIGQSEECGQTHWESLRDMRRAAYDATDAAIAKATGAAS